MATDESIRPSSSIASAYEKLSAPEPPYSSGNGMPISPSSASLPTISYGKLLVRSSSSATGFTSCCAKSRASRWMFFCSSVRSKFMRRGAASRPQPPCYAAGRTLPSMSSERGQASVEWIGLLLLLSLAFAALLAFLPAVDGRPLGAAVARALVCAVKRDCQAEGLALRRAYGERDAGLVRANAPSIAYEPGVLTLPIDYRRCRSHRCSDAPDDRDLDVHRSARGGAPATAFTHVVHRGDKTYIQYWLYYPDSPSTFMHSHGILKRFYAPLGIHDPAFHRDDWEGYQVRLDSGGATSVRATKHGGYTWCKGHIWHNKCERWGRPNGWTR